MSRSQLELQCATFPGRDVNTGSALFDTLSWWPSGSKPTCNVWPLVSRVTAPLLAKQSLVREGTKLQQSFSLIVDISGKATRSKSELLAAGHTDGLKQYKLPKNVQCKLQQLVESRPKVQRQPPGTVLGAAWEGQEAATQSGKLGR